MTKDKAIELLDNLIGMVEDNHGSDYDAAIHMAIDALKAEDVVGAVRCKDCAHYNAYKDNYMCGLNVLAYVHEDDFCSRGERADT